MKRFALFAAAAALMACAITLGAEPLHLFCAPAPTPLHLFEPAPCANDPGLRLFEGSPGAIHLFDAPQSPAVSALEPANARAETVFHREAPNLQPVPEKTPPLIAVYGPLWCQACRDMNREVGDGDQAVRLKWFKYEEEFPAFIRRYAKEHGYPVVQ